MVSRIKSNPGVYKANNDAEQKQDILGPLNKNTKGTSAPDWQEAMADAWDNGRHFPFTGADERVNAARFTALEHAAPNMNPLLAHKMTPAQQQRANRIAEMRERTEDTSDSAADHMRNLLSDEHSPRFDTAGSLDAGELLDLVDRGHSAGMKELLGRAHPQSTHPGAEEAREALMDVAKDPRKASNFAHELKMLAWTSIRDAPGGEVGASDGAVATASGFDRLLLRAERLDNAAGREWSVQRRAMKLRG
jgi:hypothetical protein